MYNIHIHGKVRVIGIEKKQNQKWFNLHALIINGWSITIRKVKILDNRGNFRSAKNWKNFEFGFHFEFYNLFLIIRYF